jgi:hypothetical protein
MDLSMSRRPFDEKDPGQRSTNRRNYVSAEATNLKKRPESWTVSSQDFATGVKIYFCETSVPASLLFPGAGSS